MKYRNRVRSRISNLKDPRNPGLRHNVLGGAISAGLIAKMTAEVSEGRDLCMVGWEALACDSVKMSRGLLQPDLSLPVSSGLLDPQDSEHSYCVPSTVLSALGAGASSVFTPTEEEMFVIPIVQMRRLGGVNYFGYTHS